MCAHQTLRTFEVQQSIPRSTSVPTVLDCSLEPAGSLTPSIQSKPRCAACDGCEHSGSVTTECETRSEGSWIGGHKGRVQLPRIEAIDNQGLPMISSFNPRESTGRAHEMVDSGRVKGWHSVADVLVQVRRGQQVGAWRAGTAMSARWEPGWQGESVPWHGSKLPCYHFHRAGGCNFGDRCRNSHKSLTNWDLVRWPELTEPDEGGKGSRAASSGDW